MGSSRYTNALNWAEYKLKMDVGQGSVKVTSRNVRSNVFAQSYGALKMEQKKQRVAGFSAFASTIRYLFFDRALSRNRMNGICKLGEWVVYDDA